MTSAETFIAQRKQSRAELNKIYRFPSVLGEFYTAIRFEKYSYSATGEPVRTGGSGTIYLPLPLALSDTQTINAGQNEIGSLGALGAQVGSVRDANDLTGPIGQLSEALKSASGATGKAIGDALQGNTAGLVEGIGQLGSQAGYFLRSGLGSVDPNVTSGYGAGVGNAVNPFATMIFSGVELKTHTLEWTLAPESPEDSEEIKKIIDIIRQNIVPEYGAVGGDTGVNALQRGLLKYPSLINVSYNGIQDDYYYKFKPGMVQSFVTDFSPQGLAVMKGGKPAQVRLQLQFQEAAIWTAQDYGAPESTSDSSANQAQETSLSQRQEEGGFGNTNVAGTGNNQVADGTDTGSVNTP